MNLVDIYRAVKTSKVLEKLAAQSEHEVRDAVLRAKIAVDEDIFEHIKTAAMSPLAAKIMKGALAASAAAIPLGVAGHMILSKADETSDLLQNRILQTALALAGVGAGLYGMHKLTSDSPKMAADDQELLEEANEKLATVGLLDELLGSVPTGLSEEATKLAAEIRALNRGYGVHLLDELAG
jgi:hypothetical protein